jgi:hypothetical protein
VFADFGVAGGRRRRVPDICGGIFRQSPCERIEEDVFAKISGHGNELTLRILSLEQIHKPVLDPNATGFP